MAVEKKVPEIRFKGFSREWETKELGELAEIVRGASPRPIEDPKWFDTSSNVGWLRIRDVTEQDGRIHYLSQRISKLGQGKTRVLFEMHLLLSIAASVGKPVINYVETGVHDGFLIFKKPIFQLEYMYQWLKSFEPRWQQYGQPGSQVNLNSDIVKGQVVNVPDEPEQVQIGNTFQKLDSLINQHQQKQDKLSNIKKAMLEKMFPKQGETVPEIRFKGFSGEWLSVLLSKIANKYDNLRIPVTAKDRISGNTPYYGANGIQGYIDGYTHDGKYVLLAEDGANDLKNYPIHYVNGKVWVNNHAHVLQANEQNSNLFLKYVLVSIDFEPFLVGGGRAKLNASVMMDIEVMITEDIEEQTIIGNYFQKLDTLINQHQQQITKLKNIKQACLSKMFV